MNDNALDVSSGAPPGGPPGRFLGGMMEWRASAAVLRSTMREAWRSPGHIASHLFDDLVTTIFPADCRACGGSLLRAASSPLNVPVCDACLAQILPQSESMATALCRFCGESMGMESSRFARNTPSEGLVCTPCRLVPPPFARAVAYGVYEDQLREMIQLLKYEGVQPLAKPLGTRLAEAVLMLEEAGFGGEEVMVMAVPLFPANERQRGYNQSVLLADAAIARLKRLRPGWKLAAAHGLLKRVKATESQFNLSPKGRRRNLAGAFRAEDAGDFLVGREVLLIDDIYTTGATSRACAQVLRRAGARRVWVATLARAQRERVALWGSSGDGERRWNKATATTNADSLRE